MLINLSALNGSAGYAFVLDTHTLVWYLEDNPKLSESCKKAIENTNNRIIISITILLEIKYLHSKKRFKTTPDIIADDTDLMEWNGLA
ncbi:MAG: type II toxin-antitoxin system VapC family toxin, partial [bacterium]